MRETARALKEFVGGFGLPAYPSGAIPKDVTLPYLTYLLQEPEWDQKASFYIQGWYRTTSYEDMLAKADQILKEIGQGIVISTRAGYIVIRPETPLVQMLTESDTRSFYINLSLNAHQMPGDYPEEGDN